MDDRGQMGVNASGENKAKRIKLGATCFRKLAVIMYNQPHHADQDPPCRYG